MSLNFHDRYRHHEHDSKEKKEIPHFSQARQARRSMAQSRVLNHAKLTEILTRTQATVQPGASSFKPTVQYQYQSPATALVQKLETMIDHNLEITDQKLTTTKMDLVEQQMRLRCKRSKKTSDSKWLKKW